MRQLGGGRGAGAPFLFLKHEKINILVRFAEFIEIVNFKSSHEYFQYKIKFWGENDLG